MIVGLLLGVGVYYPLSTIKQVESAEEVDELKNRLMAAEKELACLSNPDRWTINGEFILPTGWKAKYGEHLPKRHDYYFGSEAGAKDFWNLGSFKIIPREREPISSDIEPSKQNFEQARFKVTVMVPQGRDFLEWVNAIKYEHTAGELSADIAFDKAHRDRFEVGQHPSRQIGYELLKLEPMFFAHTSE